MYQLAYAAFRNAYCRMAASAMQDIDSAEAHRLSRDAEKYAEMLATMCEKDSIAVVAS
jgi:hypothetical protein